MRAVGVDEFAVRKEEKVHAKGLDAVEARRILFLVSSMEEGGAERVAALLCNRWVARGHEVVLMPTYSGRGECFYPLDDRVRLDYLADRVRRTSKAPWNSLRRFLALRSAMREIRPDAVVSFLTHVNVVALLASAGLDVPVVVSERICPAQFHINRIWAWGRRVTYRRAWWVVAQTAEVGRWIERHCPGSRVIVIPNPVIFPLPACGPVVPPVAFIADDRRLLLAVGRLVPQKGFDRLLEAFAKLRGETPDWDLVILGEGAERHALEARRDALGLAARVRLPGRVGNVVDWYSRADLFVMSSHYEGFPNALPEAMAHGVAAVSMDCPTGPADIVRQGVDGLLVTENAGIEGLAQAMGQVMRNDVLREAMASRAQEVRQRYFMDRLGTLWDEVLGLGELDAREEVLYYVPEL